MDKEEGLGAQCGCTSGLTLRRLIRSTRDSLTSICSASVSAAQLVLHQLGGKSVINYHPGHWKANIQTHPCLLSLQGEELEEKYWGDTRREGKRGEGSGARLSVRSKYKCVGGCY